MINDIELQRLFDEAEQIDKIVISMEYDKKQYVSLYNPNHFGWINDRYENRHQVRLLQIIAEIKTRI
jgi:hypothetical protein